MMYVFSVYRFGALVRSEVYFSRVAAQSAWWLYSRRVDCGVSVTLDGVPLRTWQCDAHFGRDRRSFKALWERDRIRR